MTMTQRDRLLSLVKLARDSALTGEQIVDNWIVDENLRVAEARDKVLGRLTDRERQVVDWLAEGSSTSEISKTLNLTISTVNTYMKRIFAKLGVHSRIELVAKVHATETSL